MQCACNFYHGNKYSFLPMEEWFCASVHQWYLGVFKKARESCVTYCNNELEKWKWTLYMDGNLQIWTGMTYIWRSTFLGLHNKWRGFKTGTKKN